MSPNTSDRLGSFTHMLAAVLGVIALAALLAQNARLSAEVARLKNGAVPVLMGKEIPKATLLTNDGRLVTTHDLTGGAPHVIYYFTTVCPYCKASVGEVSRLAAELQVQGIRLDGVALDGLDAARPYVAEHGIEWRVAAPATPTDGNALNIARVPMLVLYDESRRAIEVFRGQVDDQTVAAVLGAVGDL
jgi:peroxiredoxin